MKILSQIFLAFFRIGLFGFGGGPSMIPLVHQETVKRHAWLEDDDFADLLAIGNTLPGPIATKMAGIIGYRVAGVMGCLTAVFAVIVPIIITMIFLLEAFSRFSEERWMQGMSQGVVPVVMVMMAQLTWDFFQKSRLTLGVMVTLVIGSVSGFLIYGLGVHPGFVIGFVLLAALLRPDRKSLGANQEAIK